MVLLQLHHKFQVHFIVRPSRHHDFYQVKFFLNLEKILIAEAVGQRCSLKKLFLEISQNSQENTCARLSFLIKLQAFFYSTPLVAASVIAICLIGVL